MTIGVTEVARRWYNERRGLATHSTTTWDDLTDSQRWMVVDDVEAALETFEECFGLPPVPPHTHRWHYLKVNPLNTEELVYWCHCTEQTIASARLPAPLTTNSGVNQ
jgi:hypothetical protein